MKVGKSFFIFRNWKIIVILFLPVQWFFFSFISSQSQFIENWYSEGFFRVLSFLLRGLTSWIPFSVGEILLYFLVIFFVFRFAYRIIQLVRRQIKLILRLNRFATCSLSISFLFKSFISLLVWISIIYFLFMVLWGLNYHREPLISFEEVRTERQDFESQEYKSQDFESQEIENQDLENKDKFEKEFSTIELIGLCEKLIQQTNDYRKKEIEQEDNPNILIMDDDEIIKQAYSGFHNINIENKRLDYKIPSVKKIIFSNLFSYLGVGGIYNPFTGEANVNMDPPDFILPATVCHEMAHQAGIAPEDEANYVSYIVCRQHPNPFFQYSGTLMAMRYAMGALKHDDQIAYDELLKQISEGVQSDLAENRKYWSRFKNPFEKYSDRIYDQYLKANSQKAGIKSYSRMVRFLLYDYQKGKMAKERKGEKAIGQCQEPCENLIQIDVIR